MSEPSSDERDEGRSPLVRLVRWLWGGAVDHPWHVDVALVSVVLAHAALTYIDHIPRLSLPSLPNVWQRFTEGTGVTDAAQTYGTLVGPAALVASFAGVVVIYGLSVNTDRFRRFRAEGGEALRRTWLSASAAGFIASGCFTAALLINNLWSPATAPWFFELGLLVLVHSSIRLIAITASLIELAARDDEKAVKEADTTKREDLPFNRKAS